MPTVIRSLSQRRVPQFLAVYLGAAWGLVQFVDFVGTRYLLSPAWTDLALLMFALLLPSVLLYVWNHGSPGKDEWQRSEKMVIPANLLIVVAALGFVGAGNDLGAITTRVSVKDEKGNTIERVVPKAEYRKRLAGFWFNSPKDTSVAWLQKVMPLLVEHDLRQQNFVELVQPAFMREQLVKAATNFVDVPLGLKRQIATEMHIPYFWAGDVRKEGGDYAVDLRIYESETGKPVHERSFRGPDPFALADQITAQLLEDLEVPAIGTPDLPVTEVVTGNLEAFRRYADAVFAITMPADWAKGAQEVEEAVKLDATFAQAHLTRYAVKLFSNDAAEAQKSIQLALDHSYRLPERAQFQIKAEYYYANQDWPRGFAVLQLLTKLYPDDIQSHQMMAQMLMLRNDHLGAIASLERVLELDPSRHELRQRIGALYEAKGDLKKALAVFEEYARQFPKDEESFLKIADLQMHAGEHGQARIAYEQALIIEPNDVTALVGLARLEHNLGNMSMAEQRIEEALAASKTPEDRSKALQTLVSHYEGTGQIALALQTTDAVVAEQQKFQPLAMVLLSGMRTPGLRAQIDAERGIRELEQLRGMLQPPFDAFYPFAAMNLYTELDDAARAEQAVIAGDETIAKMQLNFLESVVVFSRGRVAEIRGQCKEAAQWYEKALALDPADPGPNEDLGRCLRKLGKRTEAEVAFNKALQVIPAHAPTHYELGLLYRDAGDHARAEQHLQKALTAWSKADAAFKPAQRARAALASVKKQGV
ncbi:MAG: tetratricopeptide repeat protein [Gemmatimonadota bacterium]